MEHLGNKLIGLGVLLLAAALLLMGYNHYESERAGSQAEELLTEMKQELPQVAPPPPEDGEMPVTEVGGYQCVGFLAIPDLGLELPVLDDWSYAKLKLAPCRQKGAAGTHDLVIAAHNYEKHFGGLKDLPKGAELTVTDMEGVVYAYRVERVEIVQPTDVDLVENSDSDLVLYTCTYSGSQRVAVFCSLIPDETAGAAPAASQPAASPAA